MRQTRRVDRWALPVLLAFAGPLAGCGGAADELPRQAVAGTVLFGGEPLKSGMIQFVPADLSASTVAGAAIINGKYVIDRAEGPVPGNYVIKISSTSTDAAPAPTPGEMPGDAPPPSNEPIPAKYNAMTTLEAKVTKQGPNTFDYKMESEQSPRTAASRSDRASRRR